MKLRRNLVALTLSKHPGIMLKSRRGTGAAWNLMDSAPPSFEQVEVALDHGMTPGGTTTARSAGSTAFWRRTTVEDGEPPAPSLRALTRPAPPPRSGRGLARRHRRLPPRRPP